MAFPFVVQLAMCTIRCTCAIVDGKCILRLAVVPMSYLFITSKPTPRCTCTSIIILLGQYWVDPTEGSSQDAFQVYCSGQETCIKPTNEEDEVGVTRNGD